MRKRPGDAHIKTQPPGLDSQPASWFQGAAARLAQLSCWWQLHPWRYSLGYVLSFSIWLGHFTLFPNPHASSTFFWKCLLLWNSSNFAPSSNFFHVGTVLLTLLRSRTTLAPALDQYFLAIREKFFFLNLKSTTDRNFWFLIDWHCVNKTTQYKKKIINTEPDLFTI